MNVDRTGACVECSSPNFGIRRSTNKETLVHLLQQDLKDDITDTCSCGVETSLQAMVAHRSLCQEQYVVCTNHYTKTCGYQEYVGKHNIQTLKKL